MDRHLLGLIQQTRHATHYGVTLPLAFSGCDFVSVRDCGGELLTSVKVWLSQKRNNWATLNSDTCAARFLDM